jgi:mRNA-degrading endonuclease RelE of RelBE toxin-antitoxin system
MYEVIIKPRAEKEFAKLPKELKKKFYAEFKKLSENPFEHPHIKKIKNTKFGWRLRIGRWRILFALFDKEKRIEIVDIFLRKGEEDYKKRMKLIK